MNQNEYTLKFDSAERLLCSQWYEGQRDPMYQVSSSGWIGLGDAWALTRNLQLSADAARNSGEIGDEMALIELRDRVRDWEDNFDYDDELDLWSPKPGMVVA